MTSEKYFKTKIKDQICYLTFENKEEKVNKLDFHTLFQLEKFLDDIAKNNDIKALVFKSAKKNIFIAGADINEIKDLKDEKETLEKVLQGQKIISKIEKLKIPTISLINGACMGGGLELALACKYRFATINEKTKLALPEVKLGIIPGFGGTQRMPRLVGLRNSLDLIISGRSIDSRKAFKIGLVDQISAEEFANDNLAKFISEICLKDKNKILKNRNIKNKKRFIEETILGKKFLIFYFTKKSIIKKSKNKYPALLAAFDVIFKTYNINDKEEGLKIELEAFAKVATQKVAKNLISIFFSNEKINKFSDKYSSDVKINQISVVGAGIMGGGIAWLFTNNGFMVRMKDVSQDAIINGYRQIIKYFNQLKKRKKITQNSINNKINKISSGLDYSGFKKSDIVVEAAVENIEIKKNIFQELEKEVSKDTIIASNTSSLDIDEMAQYLKYPERFIGMHFFNPVNRMPLVEVIKGKNTSEQTIATIVQLSKKLGKTPIVVKNKAGFLVNRILIPYINEAAKMITSVNDIKIIDEAMENFGMPMGPFLLADNVGIDVGYKVAKILEDNFGERMKISNFLQNISKSKFLGVKNGKGFYKYKNNKNIGLNKEIINFLPKSKDAIFVKNDIIKRCLFLMINEAAKCLEEGIVQDTQTVDIAMIMGAGFPPFHGGLMKYAENIGIDNLIKDMEKFSKKYGDRFTPCNFLSKIET
jgi:3-hydroxyacyl-CoA dehydrogenase/enoyl-CoA hydratase/3-hydroxybutyryl-CoA epimerase